MLEKTYSKILKLEAKKIAKTDDLSKLNKINDKNYCLSTEELENISNNQEWKELYEKGFIIKLSDNCYRTIHMDLMIRASGINIHPSFPSMAISYWFSLITIPFPSKKDRNIIPIKKEPEYTTSDYDYNVGVKLYNSIEKVLGNNTEIFVRIIKEYFNRRGSSGFDLYQATALIDAFQDYKTKKGYVITAPTGYGKTEVFLSIILIDLLNEFLNNKNFNAKYILIYPRKMLEIDQLSRLLELVDIANTHIPGYKKIKVFLRDGDTGKIDKDFKNEMKEKQEKPYRGIKCGKNGELFLRKENGEPVIYCIDKDNGSKQKIDFLIPLPSEEAKSANIIITNIWTLYNRLTSRKDNDLDALDLLETRIILLDELHEYDSVPLASISYLINILDKIIIETKHRELKLLAASATIRNPDEILGMMLGVSKDNIGKLTYETLDKKYNFVDKLSSIRNIITLHVQMKPRYSWVSYISEFSTRLLFIYWERSENKIHRPQAIFFINNIKELNRTMTSIKEALYLGSPLDHLCKRKYECNDTEPISNEAVMSHYYIESPRKIKEIVNSVAKQKRGSLKDYMFNLYEKVFSDIPLKERSKIYDKIRRKELALVLATTSLELGVDYPNIDIILNSGYDKIERLIQRIGRGGRGIDTLNTVLSIILARNNPMDYRIFSNRKMLEAISMLDSKSLRKKQVPISLENIKIQAVLRLPLIAIATGLIDDEYKKYLSKPLEKEAYEDFLKTLNKLFKNIKLRDFITKYNIIEQELLNEIIDDISSMIEKGLLEFMFELEDFLDGVNYNLIIEEEDELLNDLLVAKEYFSKKKDEKIEELLILLNFFIKELKKIRQRSLDIRHSFENTIDAYLSGDIKVICSSLQKISEKINEKGNVKIEFDKKEKNLKYLRIKLNNEGLLTSEDREMLKTLEDKLRRYNSIDEEESIYKIDYLLKKWCEDVER